MNSVFRRAQCAARLIPILAGIGLLSAVGCGSGSGNTNLQRGPTASTNYPTNSTPAIQTFTVTNALPPFGGKDVTVRVEITSATGLDVTNNPPKIDVLGPGRTSIINGPQLLQSLNSDPNGWIYVLNIPANTPTQQYTFLVYAQDTFGNKGNTPYNLGSASLP